jgi:hypothetical protein
LSFFGVEGAYGDLWAPAALDCLIFAACGSVDCFALMDMDRRATASLAMTPYR